MPYDDPDFDKTASTPTHTGDHILHYLLLNSIGSGGMGEVYLARDEKLDRLVALKTLIPTVSDDSDHWRRLINEARAAAKLSHKNVCAVYAIEEENGRFFIAMEYVQGLTLRQLVKSDELTMDSIRDIAVQSLDGLQAAHDEGIIHRDIKSSNIMIDKYGTVKILDFGLAKITSDVDATETRGVKGTFQYMSPEQIAGKTIDNRSDIFSLGVVLYELITRHLPFGGDNIATVAYSIVNESPTPMKEYCLEISPDLNAVVERALSKHVNDRYQSAAQMRSDIGSSDVTSVLTKIRPSIREKTLAVLPFRNVSGNPDDEYLSDGIYDDVVTAIVKMPALSVASRAAVKRLMKRDMEYEEIGRQLKAGYILDGTLRRQGDQIKLNVQMTRTSDDIIEWSHSFERRPDDIFSLQTDIAAQIAAALNVTVSGTQLDIPSRAPDVDPEAYELYLRGKHHLKRRDEDSVLKAVELLGRATAMDDRFAEAFGELAVACGLCESYGYSGASQYAGRAREYAEKAIELNPGSSQAHMSMFYHLRGEDLRRAISELRTAIALDSSNSEAYHYLAHCLMFSGDYSGAERAEMTANLLDPFMEMSDANLCHLFFLTGQNDRLQRQLESMRERHGLSRVVNSTRGWIEWCSRNWKGALEFFSRSMDKHDLGSITVDHLADCNIRLGDFDAAVTLLKRSIDSIPDSGMFQARLGQAYSKSGREDLAARYFDKAEEFFLGEGADRPNMLFKHAFRMSWFYALKEDSELAVEHLTKAVDRGYGNYAELRLRPDWDSLRGDAEFEKLVDDVSSRASGE